VKEETEVTTTKKQQALSFEEATKAWTERTKAWQEQMENAQQSALENLAKSYELFAEGLRRQTQSAQPAPPAPNWAQVAQSVDAAYDFAVELINRQRTFAKSVLEAAAAAPNG
jgi:hypothetical protein